MMLWDIIRNFFVQYIFGGTMSNGDLIGGFFGSVANEDYTSLGGSSTSSLFIPFKAYVDWDFTEGVSWISVGDWLSTTFTIITLVGFCIFLFLIIRWFFRIGSSLISYR